MERLVNKHTLTESVLPFVDIYAIISTHGPVVLSGTKCGTMCKTTAECSLASGYCVSSLSS